jgi:hypothetical protein
MGLLSEIGAGVLKVSDAMGGALVGSSKGKNNAEKKARLEAELKALNDQLTLKDEIKQLEADILKAKAKLGK